MSKGRFPAAYVNDVAVDDKNTVYVPFPTMGIGARKSGLPKDVADMHSLEHVGKSAGGSK